MRHADRVEVFDRLRARHLRFLTAVLWRLTGDRELFAEAMQYALLGLWQHAQKLEGAKAGGYIYRIALSANSKAWRQRIGRNGDIDLRPTCSDESPGHRIDRADLAARVRRAIAVLPQRQAKAIVMRHLEQEDYPAIAARLDCSEATARSHVSKAVATLRSRLAAHVG
jgi:RNA polymerase sigma factor (sigma-70 family)